MKPLVLSWRLASVWASASPVGLKGRNEVPQKRYVCRPEGPHGEGNTGLGREPCVGRFTPRNICRVARN